jgi:hypothetical protein
VRRLEDEKRSLEQKLEEKTAKLNETDRMKQIENLIQSQRWGELGQLAESMKKLSTTMVSTSSNDSSSTKTFRN